MMRYCWPGTSCPPSRRALRAAQVVSTIAGCASALAVGRSEDFILPLSSKSVIALVVCVWEALAAPMSEGEMASLPPVAWLDLCAVGVLASERRESSPAATVPLVVPTFFAAASPSGGLSVKSSYEPEKSPLPLSGWTAVSALPRLVCTSAAKAAFAMFDEGAKSDAAFPLSERLPLESSDAKCPPTAEATLSALPDMSTLTALFATGSAVPLTFTASTTFTCAPDAIPFSLILSSWLISPSADVLASGMLFFVAVTTPLASCEIVSMNAVAFPLADGDETADCLSFFPARPEASCAAVTSPSYTVTTVSLSSSPSLRVIVT